MFVVAQIIISILLIAVILMQSSGTGLGSSWSGGGQSYHSRRGFEKVVFRATIGLAVLFVTLSILPIVGLV